MGSACSKKQNPEDMFSAETAPRTKRLTDGLNGTVYDGDGMRRGSTRDTEAELRAELAGRKVSQQQVTIDSDSRTVFSAPEPNGGLPEPPLPVKSELETISSPNKDQQKTSLTTSQHPPPRPLLITQTSATELRPALVKKPSQGSSASSGYGYSSGGGGGGGSGSQRPQVDWVKLAKETQEENYKVLREEFRRNPQLFLANQLMMSVQFFKNFDR